MKNACKEEIERLGTISGTQWFRDSEHRILRNFVQPSLNCSQTKSLANKNFANYLSSNIWYAFEQKRVLNVRLAEHLGSLAIVLTGVGTTHKLIHGKREPYLGRSTESSLASTHPWWFNA